MAETVRNIFDKALALLNQYSDDGVRIPDADVVDLMMKSIPLADMAQKELYKVGKLYKTFEFDNKPSANLLGLLSNFDAVDFDGTVKYYPSESGVVGSRAYYFEVNRDTAIVTIEELISGTWTVIETPTITSGITSYTGFKGILASSTNARRMKFDGTTHYRHINRCLYSAPFALVDVPDYRPWFKVEMPTDFRTIDQVIEEYPTRQYGKQTASKWESNKYLYINYYYDGNIRIVYKPVPADITAITDTLEIDDITAQAIVYYVAARLAPFKKKELVTFFESKYIELKIENAVDTTASSSEIIDVYSVGSGNNGIL
jgi:hypothetical protein